MNATPLPDFPHVIDATMRSAWLACPHLFFRRHVQGLTRPRVNVHLHFGAVFARALEVARRSYFANADAASAVHDACVAAVRAWGAFEGPSAPSRSEANKTLSAVLTAIVAYFREWPLDTDPVRIHSHHGEPAIEYSGAYPIPGSRHPQTGDPILYSGRFDLIGDFQSAHFGLDDKTTGADPNSDYWRNQWTLRSQFTGYVWLAREYGIPLKGFIVRGIGILTHDIRLGWALTPRPPWLVDTWLRQLQDDVNIMVAQYNNLVNAHLPRAATPDGDLLHAHPFPQVFDAACADFGGCDFLDLCSSEHPDDWLDSHEVSHWNPLTRTET